MKTCKNTSKGFTLLEVVVAVAIIVTGFFAVYSLYLRTMTASSVIRFYIKAPQLARKKIADIDSNIRNISDSSGDFGEDFPGFVWKITKSDIQSKSLGATAERLKKFDVKIVLNEGEGTYEVTVFRYIPGTGA